MARGFELVLQDWDGFDRADIGTFLKKIAVVITSRIGGTSGPIWGTAFLRAGATAGATAEERVAADDVAAAILRAAARTARDRAEATRPMQAMRGRASYTGERSIGTLDAGAVAVAVMAGTSITLSRLDSEVEGLLAAPAEIAIRTF